MSPKGFGPLWSRRPRRAMLWTPRPTASMSASPTGTASTPSPPRMRNCPASRSSRPRPRMVLPSKMPFTPLRASPAPSAPPSPPGRTGPPWWRTCLPACSSSRRSSFQSRSCGLPVSRPLPCGPARSARHGLRTTPGPDWRSSSGILPTALPSRELPTRFDRSTGISWILSRPTPMAGPSWRWPPQLRSF